MSDRRRRPFSKNARFRLFVAALSLVYSFAFLSVAWIQARFSSRRLASLRSDFESRFEKLASEMSERVAVVSSGVADTATSAPTTTGDPSLPPDAPRYLVMGSGRTGRWGYFDLLFLDGSCNRYYFRRDVPEDLMKAAQLVEIDDFRHRYQVALPSRPSRSADPVLE